MKLLAVCLLAACSLAAKAADLHMLSDHHPPLHFMQGEEMVGFGVDVVRELAERTGDTAHLEQLPLRRALRDASIEPDTAVFTILRTPERESQYQWVGPLMDIETALYSGVGPAPALHTLQDAKAAEMIVLPRKWWTYQYLQDQGWGNLYGVDSPEQMMHLLRLGRTLLVVADTSSANQWAEAAGFNPGELHYQMTLLTQSGYIAFSPNTDPLLIKRWQQALHQMGREGRLQQLRQRWKIDRPSH